MLTSKQMILKPILESKDGIHLTAYLVNRGNLIDLKAQLRATINETYEWLDSAMSHEERKRFLEPLDGLLLDARIFKQMAGNIGIFRNKDFFRILNIPVEIEQSCQVATSFHVKPLLRWLQTDREFLLLGIEKDSAHLYLGSQDSFKRIDSILFPDSLKGKSFLHGYLGLKESRRNRLRRAETFAWLNEWIAGLTTHSKPKLFIAGDKGQVEHLNKCLKYPHAVKTAIANSFGPHNVLDICSNIRKLLKEESKKSLEKALLEFRFADEDNKTRKNIFQIAKAVVEGRVRKLIVTDQLCIFGRIDSKSGGLAIHPYDLDHEDDDVLDDLAQMVLSQGGEVVIAKRDEIPNGRPILAILEDGGQELEKSEELKYSEVLQERFG